MEGRLIEVSGVYQIALSDFCLKGMIFPLTPDHEGVLKVYEPKPSEPASDIRKTIITYLKT